MAKGKIQILKQVIQGIQFGGNILSLSDDGTDTTLVLSDFFYLREGVTITIDSIDYLVKSADWQVNEIVISGVIASANSFTIPSLFFKSGSRRMVSGELSGDQTHSFPLCFLALPYLAGSKAIGDGFGDTITAELLFLDESDYRRNESEQFQMNTDQFAEFVDYVEAQLFDSTCFYSIQRNRGIEFQKHGTYDKAGALQSFFDVDVTGIFRQYQIRFKNCNC